MLGVRRKEKLEKIIEDIRKDGYEVAYEVIDVTKYEDIQQFIQGVNLQ